MLDANLNKQRTKILWQLIVVIFFLKKSYKKVNIYFLNIYDFFSFFLKN